MVPVADVFTLPNITLAPYETNSGVISGRTLWHAVGMPDIFGAFQEDTVFLLQ